MSRRSSLREEFAQDDKKNRVDDASSMSFGADSYVEKTVKASHFLFENVRFSPEIIEFIDAFEGKQFTVKITIQNVGRNPVFIKIGEPNSFIFQLKKPIRHVKLLSSGASVTGTVTYTYHNDDLVQSSQIPVQINGQMVYYPIVVRKAEPKIEVQPQKLHFKVINLGASAKSMMLTIHNTGGKRTKFEIDVGKNYLDLVVNPIRGTVKPKQVVDVRVEMMGLCEGEYYQELWINTSEIPIRVPVLVEVVRPRLEIVYPNGTEDFYLVDFKPTFIGTQTMNSFVLKNLSAETTLFIILAEVNGELQMLNQAKTTADAFSMFIMTAEEGHLEPFENRILNVLFRPKRPIKKKGWHHEELAARNQPNREFIVFFRINRVHCLDYRELAKLGIKQSIRRENNSSHSQMPADKRSTVDTLDNLMSNGPPEEELLRLCLHGQAVEPDVVFQPTCFEFGDLTLGQTVNKVLNIKNNSIIRVKCKIIKTMNVFTNPKEIWLNPEKSHEFLVSLTPRTAGKFNAKMKVQILAESDVVLEENKTLEIIAVHVVILTYNANDVPFVPNPKIGLGITPMVTDEVGFQKELITFKDAYKLPFAAVLGLKYGFKPLWMKNEKDNVNYVDNAIIALPNDRPRLFYTWPEEKICRTIFKGILRYSPPEDLAYTFSSEGRIVQKERRAIWDDFVAILAKSRQKQTVVSCHTPYKGIKITSNTEDNSRSMQKYSRDGPSIAKYLLLPMTPLFLFKVNVQPRLITFGTVAEATTAQETITINNENVFPVTVKFMPGKSAMFVTENGVIKIAPSTTKSINVYFRSSELGRHFGFLTYIINENHIFEISISAFVTSKILFIPDEFTSIEFGKFSSTEAFQPRSIYMPLENVLHSPVKYKWDFAPDCAFFTPIIEGQIPPRSILLTEIRFELDPKKSFYSEVSLISENGSAELIKLSYPQKKVNVDFICGRVDMHEIPLNLPTNVKPIIQNSSYHEVSFVVTNPNPMPGVVVEPKEGVIKPRSYFHLDVTVQIPVIMAFCFEVALITHFVNRISVRVAGKVVLPDIRMRPSEVIMRKICAHSFDTVTMCVENAGITPAEVAIDFKNSPEFKIVDDQKLYLSPGKSSKIVMKFEPNDAARYIFYLPVIINRILGPPVIQELDTEFVHFYIEPNESVYGEYEEVYRTSSSKLRIPCVCVNSTVTQSLIRISTTNINFRLVSESELEFQSEKIEISNDFVDFVTFCIRNDDLGEINNSPFNLTPCTPHPVEYRMKSMKVTLKRGEKFILQATFDPKKPGIYNVDVPIFVRGYSKGLVYNFIHLRGKFKPPAINPECSEVHFPPLPLGVGCDVNLTICAHNYISADTINFIISEPRDGDGDCSQSCLTAKWLTEPHVTPQRNKSQSFQLQLQFQSPTPIALRCHVVFFDSSGSYGSVFVTAVADNSSVTDHLFLSMKPTKYRYLRDPFITPRWKTDEVMLSYPVKSSDLKILNKTPKLEPKESIKSSNEANSETTLSTINLEEPVSLATLPIDRGPRLVVQMTKSMTRITELNLVNTGKPQTECKIQTNSSTAFIPPKPDLNSFISRSESLISSRTSNRTYKRTEQPNEFTYPNFPAQDTAYRKYLLNTLNCIEKWIYEVVMRCDQYFSIPQSLRRIKKTSPPQKSFGVKRTSTPNVEKDFLDLLEEIIGRNRNLPTRPYLNYKDFSEEKANIIRSFFNEILQFLESNGCLLPHVKPEYLMDYENYSVYMKNSKTTEHLSWSTFKLRKMNSLKPYQDRGSTKPKGEIFQQTSSKLVSVDSWNDDLFEGFYDASEMDVVKPEDKTQGSSGQKMASCRDLVNEKKFEHPIEILDKTTFELRSTQAWLDIMIQVFKVFVLSKVVLKNTIPHVVVNEMNEKIGVENVDLSCVRNYNKRHKGILTNTDSITSNIYSIQERILLVWLNHHLQVQKELLWGPNGACLLRGKILNNFDKDLSDSVALISVTASHCPYIVPDYFQDVFPKPDTPNKIHHNAGKLVQVWRTLRIGLTLETTDIVKPNPVFMVMLVTHLYEILPYLHPHSLICFSTPLNSEISRSFNLRNDSQQRILYEAKFFGEHEGSFSLKQSPLVELKNSKPASVNVVFNAKKIKKISATLVLSGCVESPDFGKPLAFYLEGEPSEFPERDKLSFTAPLHKVLCAEIPVRPPYPDPVTYEVWYTTKQPENSGEEEPCSMFKPWSKIWNRKVSRRLFLNDSEVTIPQGETSTTLSVTVACLTNRKRLFWLLFRSKLSDFIILVEIKSKLIERPMEIKNFYGDAWSSSATCLCPSENRTKAKEAKATNCPFFTDVKIPIRNEALWDALRTMFGKTLHPKEKSFWDQHFELNIGLSLILWLISPEEEEEVVDEFVQILSTKVSYTVNIESGGEHVVFPPKIEISDVRERAELAIPIHISPEAPTPFAFKFSMTSDSKKEVRNYLIKFHPLDSSTRGSRSQEDSKVVNFVCRPIADRKNEGFCKQKKRKKISENEV